MLRPLCVVEVILPAARERIEGWRFAETMF